MLLGNVIDKLHNEDGLTNTRTAKKTDLTALCVGRNQVNDLDTRFQDLRRSLLLGIRGRISVNTPFFLCLGLRTVINSLTQKIKDSAECLFADRHRNACSRIHSLHASGHTVRGGHGDTADNVIAHLACNLANHLRALMLDLDGIEKVGQMTVFKFDIQNRSDDLNYLTDVFFHLCFDSFPRKSEIFSWIYSASAPETISVISCVITA